jgi:hypothetical protein
MPNPRSTRILRFCLAFFDNILSLISSMKLLGSLKTQGVQTVQLLGGTIDQGAHKSRKVHNPDVADQVKKKLSELKYLQYSYEICLFSALVIPYL